VSPRDDRRLTLLRGERRAARDATPDLCPDPRSRAASGRRALLAVLVALPIAPVLAQAPAAAQLRAFIEGTRSAQAAFTQSVFDSKGRRVQEARGTMQFARPGRFRWEYDSPVSQLLVGDGEQVWMHDRDLNQVTVRRLDRALTGTPAALLAGSNEVEKAFAVKAMPGRGDGLEWIEAVPRDAESAFSAVRLGFARGEIAAMEIVDGLGGRTVVRFEAVQRNPRLGPQLFRFTPPRGADVIDERR
jgi:outer membrane lipoprotein carrier protein